MEARFEFDQQRMLDNLIEMIRIDSEEGTEGAMTAYIERWLTAHGFEYIRDHAGATCGSTGDNVIVHIPGTMPGEAICFNAHQDTVKPGKGIQPRVENGRLVSGGDTILGADDKSGIAMLFEALLNLKEKNIPHREMYYLFTIGEETGMWGAKALDPALVPCRSFFAIDGAGEIGPISVSGPGAVDMRAEFRGRASHAGIEPEKGISAILMMAEAMRNMPLGRIDFETTSNIGTVGGGKADNIIPENAWFTVEARSHKEEKLNAQIAAIRTACEQAAEKFGGTVEFTVTPSYPPCKQEEDWFIYRCCYDAHVKEGVTPHNEISGGGGDCNILSGKGYQCGGISTGMNLCHTLQEYLDLNDFALAYRIVMRMMTDGVE